MLDGKPLNLEGEETILTRTTLDFYIGFLTLGGLS